MVQAEVADRMTAPPGSRVYGVPSVKLAWFASARRAGPVPRAVFWPVPNVDSGLVAFARHAAPPDPGVRRGGHLRRDRRRVLAAPQDAARGAGPLGGHARRAERILRAAGVDPGARGESLTVAEFARIAAAAPGSSAPARG